MIAIALSFLVMASKSGEKCKKQVFYSLIYPLLVCSFVIMTPLSQYLVNYQDYGYPILLNIDRSPPPPIFGDVYYPYAGIVSIQDGFFTFKFTDLINNPITPLDETVQPASHRTSFWTRLYGSSNSLHFENYPPSWRVLDKTHFWIFRGIFLLAIIPTLFLGTGAIKEIYDFIKVFFVKNTEKMRQLSYGLFALVLLGYVSFAALYAYQYRTYSVMKAVFIYPGIIAYASFGAAAINAFLGQYDDKKWHRWFVTILITLLIMFYIADAYILYLNLTQDQSGLYILIDRLQYK